jgi:8-oxo-dGTP diphosphatase
MIRRYGEAVRADVDYRPRPGVYAILPRDGAFLLTVQTEPSPEVQLPGGGIDPGESPLRALHREVREETGWSIAGPRRLGAFRRFTFMEDYGFWAEKLCHVYVARPVIAQSAPQEAHHTAIWVEAEAALSMVENPGDAGFLRHYLRRFGI